MEPNNNPAPNPAGGIIQPEGGAPVPQTPMPDQPVGQKPPGGKGKKLALIILAVLALLLLAGGAYYMYFRDSDEPEAPQQSQQQESESSEEVTQFSCEEGFTEFQGDNIGLHFCYPVSWGNASLEDSQEVALGHLAAGSKKLIKFSNNTTVVGGLMSRNFEHKQEFAHGGLDEPGRVSMEQAKESKQYIKANHIYIDTEDQSAYVDACLVGCYGEAYLRIVYSIRIKDNPTYDVVQFYQAAELNAEDYTGMSDEEAAAMDLTQLFPKTDSRFTLLQQVADSVRN